VFTYLAFLNPKTWRYIVSKRRRIKIIRKVSDHQIVRLFTGKIEHQETKNFLVDKLGNPVLDGIWRVMKKIIVW